jgi:hypothetical protein
MALLDCHGAIDGDNDHPEKSCAGLFDGGELAVAGGNVAPWAFMEARLTLPQIIRSSDDGCELVHLTLAIATR